MYCWRINSNNRNSHYHGSCCEWWQADSGMLLSCQHGFPCWASVILSCFVLFKSQFGAQSSPLLQGLVTSGIQSFYHVLKLVVKEFHAVYFDHIYPYPPPPRPTPFSAHPILCLLFMFCKPMKYNPCCPILLDGWPFIEYGWLTGREIPLLKKADSCSSSINCQ